MKTTIRAAAAVVTLSAASASHAQQAVQWKVSDGGNGHWYLVVVETSSVEWETARLNAVSVGGHLAMAKSSLALEFIFRLTSQRPDSWIPFNTSWLGPWLGAWQAAAAPEPAGGWSWVDGSTVDLGSARADLNNSTGCGVNEDRLVFWKASSPPVTPATPDFATSDLPGRGYCEPQYSAVVSYIIEWSADCNNDGIVDYGQCRDGSLPDFNGNNVPDCCETGTPCVVGNYPVQWRVVDGGNGHWYQLSIPPFDVTWPAANVASRSVGGRLGQIESAAERQFLFDLCASSPAAWNISGGGALGPWIGGLQQSGAVEPDSGWIWTDGTPVDFEACRFVVSYPSGCGTNEDRMSFWCPDPASVYVGSIAYETSDFPAGGMCGTLGPIRAFVTEWSADCNNDGIVDKGQILKGQLVDADANGVPDICEDPCPGDITNGGTVDATDLSIVLAAWGTNGQGEFQADIDNSGLVDGGDLALVLGGWGPCPQ